MTTHAPVEAAVATARRLEGPKSYNELADLLTKVAFGGATVAIAFAGFALNSSIDKANRRHEIYTFLSAMPTEASTAEQIQKASFLTQVCHSYLQDLDDSNVVGLCNAIPRANGATIQQVNQQTAPVAQQLADGGEATAYLDSPQATAQNNLVAATEPVASGAQDRWFAVIGTVPASQPAAARALAAQLAKLLPADVIGDRTVQIFKTKISNSFAITVGGAIGKGEAAHLAANLRQSSSMFNDAFAQPDRAWTPVS